ncbi:hypothetical protein BHYA_0200g00080 [Botrytis hyacinthi]|uniref:Uncharacterized protein n=1 Tax=Botrytis hyacinthi TaxID=278943 RepID=A0A4Z1GKF8_9HELO|nr:hypothetical protein BHYA_0200g00080 [Botrytis hyacinthi]
MISSHIKAIMPKHISREASSSQAGLSERDIISMVRGVPYREVPKSIDNTGEAVPRQEEVTREERPKTNIPKKVPGPERVSDRQKEPSPRRKLDPQRATGSITVPNHRTVQDAKKPDPKKASGPKKLPKNGQR